jgi:hypothetical protein
VAGVLPRVRSHCRFRKRGTECVSDSDPGIKWMSRWYQATMRPSPSLAVGDVGRGVALRADEAEDDGEQHLRARFRPPGMLPGPWLTWNLT